MEMSLVRLIIHPNEEGELSFEVEATCVTVGTAADNDICIQLPSISPHHFKIEKRKEGWFVVDLHSKQGTAVRDAKVTEAPIDRGTIFSAGDVHILFDTAEREEEMEAVPGNMLPAVSRTQSDLVVTGVTPCWRCHQPVPAGTAYCPACGADQRGAYVPSPFVSPVESAAAPGAGLMPLVAFIMSVLGPLMLGVGWLVGIILGFVSISIIRRRGGHVSDVRRAHLAVYIGFAWFVILAAGIGWYVYESGTERIIRRNETAVMEQLRDIAVAETYCKLSMALDRNKNGVGEYGTLADLVSNRYGNVAESLASNPSWRGYTVKMLRADESDFLCAAEPQMKNMTGTRVFTIARDGFVHGADIPGQYSQGTELKRIDTKSIVDARADELVRDIHEVAALALRAKQYEKAQTIVRLTRERFPTCDEIAKLDAVDKQASPFVVEIRALELLAEASNAFAQGQVLREIELLQTLRDKYPTYSGIEIVDTRLKDRKDKSTQEIERTAQQVLDKAIMSEVKLDFAEAEKGYRTVANQYPDSAAGKEAGRRIGLLAERKSDESANKMLQEAFSLDLDKQYHDILSRIEQLKRAFGQAVVVSQATERLATLEKQATARIHAADGRAACLSNEWGRALASFERAAAFDPAYVQAFASNYARVLLYGVSNACAASDYDSALAYAERFQTLRIDVAALPASQVDQIRLAMAQLALSKGQNSNAFVLIKAIGDRLNDNPKMSITAGKIFDGIGEYAKAAECFTRCVAVRDYAHEARPLLIASAARAALSAESNICAVIGRDPEWATLARTFALVIPGVTNAAATSTWQNLCIDLADQIDMSSELLTSSDELFVEKQEARNELNASMRKLQNMLDQSIKNHRDIVLAARSAAEWWGIALEHATNYPAASMTVEARTWTTLFAKKHAAAKSASELLEHAAREDYRMKNDIQDYLKDLVRKLDYNTPIRNVLSTMKKFYADQRPTEYARKGLSSMSVLSALQTDLTRVATDFSSL